MITSPWRCYVIIGAQLHIPAKAPTVEPPPSIPTAILFPPAITSLLAWCVAPTDGFSCHARDLSPNLTKNFSMEHWTFGGFGEDVFKQVKSIKRDPLSSGSFWDRHFHWIESSHILRYRAPSATALATAAAPSSSSSWESWPGWITEKDWILDPQ